MATNTTTSIAHDAWRRPTRRVSGAALCLLAVLVIGGSATPSASATEAIGEFPVYVRCVGASQETVHWQPGKAPKEKTVYTGAWADKACTTPDTKDAFRTKGSHPGPEGRYEREEADSGTFEATGKDATFVTHSTKGVAESVACKLAVSRGEFFDSDVYATDRMIFEGCVANGEKKTDLCGNAGPEVIKSEPLFSALVWLDKARSEPGVLLEAEGEHIATFKCGAEQVDLEGYLIGTVEDAKKGHTITFALNAAKQQAHRSVWLFGSEIVGLNLYTLSGTHHVESTLEAVETQSGTGVY